MLTYDQAVGGAQNFPLSVIIAQVEATPESAVFKSPLPRIDFVYLPNVISYSQTSADNIRMFCTLSS